jgi:glycosyltransferase involved in cell wall biosynthesis
MGYTHEVVGGTEAYVHRLNLALLRRGIDVVAAFFTAHPDRGTFEGVPLIGLPMPPKPRTRFAYWECEPHGVDRFEQLLAEVRPKVVHFHATLQVHPPEYLELARRAGARTLWTFHAQGQTCLQTALLRNGHIPCDGRIEPARCARCGLIWSGLPWPVAAFFGAFDLSALSKAIPTRLSHPFERRLGVIRFRERLERARSSLDHWVTHARWVDDLLVLNGLAGSTLKLPLPPPTVGALEADHSPWSGLPDGIRLLYAGRLQDQKGPQIPLMALRGPLRDAPVGLVLLAPLTGTTFEAQIKALVAAEPRARLLPPRDPPGTLAVMSSADAVVVPSVWKETGPYTVLEAQWVGTPVIGAGLGGIAERLEDDTGSATFVPANVDDLARAVRSFLGRRRDMEARASHAQLFRDTYHAKFENALSRLVAMVKG